MASEAYLGTAVPLIILDGLLGLGAKPPLRDPIRAACRSINQLRAKKGAYVFAVDLPTGLDGDSGKADRDCVVADFTVTIGFAKPGLVADDALNFVGRLEVVHLDELRSPEKKAKEVVAAPASSSRITAEAQIQHIQEPMWTHWCCCWFQGIHRRSSDDVTGRVACWRRAGRSFCS